MREIHVPPAKHLRKVLVRLERFKDVRNGGDFEILYRDMERIILGLLGEWEPPNHDYDDEDEEGAFLSSVIRNVE